MPCTSSLCSPPGWSTLDNVSRMHPRQRLHDGLHDMPPTLMDRPRALLALFPCPSLSPYVPYSPVRPCRRTAPLISVPIRLLTSHPTLKTTCRHIRLSLYPSTYWYRCMGMSISQACAWTFADSCTFAQSSTPGRGCRQQARGANRREQPVAA
eukprot:365943-Chlamydomonas_euryale.AAC.12